MDFEWGDELETLRADVRRFLAEQSAQDDVRWFFALEAVAARLILTSAVAACEAIGQRRAAD